MTWPESSSPAPLLVLNGAEDRLQVVIGGASGLLASFQATAKGRANELMIPAVERCLEVAGLSPGGVSGIVCVRGPGSFTGLRLVLAAAMGMGMAACVPLAGLDYLPLLAHGPAGLLGGSVCVLTHARTRQVYAQAFSAPDASPLAPPALLDVAQARELVRGAPAPRHILGSGYRRNEPHFRELDAVVLDSIWDTSSPDRLLQAALGLDSGAFSGLAPAPLYLRASDAEENLATIAAARGLSLDEALARLRKATQAPA